MAGLIDPYLDEVLDYYFGAVSPPASVPPATWFVGLFETLPADSGSGGTEVAWSGYARQSVSNDLTEWPDAAAGAKSNANPIDFGTAGSGPTDVRGVGIWDNVALTGAAHLWYWNELTGQPISVPNGADFSFSAGALVISRCA